MLKIPAAMNAATPTPAADVGRSDCTADSVVRACCRTAVRSAAGIRRWRRSTKGELANSSRTHVELRAILNAPRHFEQARGVPHEEWPQRVPWCRDDRVR